MPRAPSWLDRRVRKWISEVQSDSKRRFDAPKMPPLLSVPAWEKPSAILQRNVYWLVARVRKLDGPYGELIETIASEQMRGRAQRSMLFAADPYHVTLTAAEPRYKGGAPYLPASTKSRLVNELIVADEHGVPAEYLTGFILQIGRLDAGWQGAATRMMDDFDRMEKRWSRLPHGSLQGERSSKTRS